MNLSFRGPVGSMIRVLLCSAVAAAGLSLAACKGAVGSGNAPQRAEITASGTLNQIATLRMYQCLTSAVSVVLFFTDNSVGDFTSRVKWSSSNPGAVMVSNGDIPVRGATGFYANGVLVPAGPGNAIITADYFGIQAQLAVSVGTPQNITLKSVLNSQYVPLTRYNLNSTSATTGFSLGTGSTMQLAVTAILDGVETDVTKFATLGFQVANDSVASINPSTAVLTAGIAGGPMVPQASFAPCDLTTISDQSKIIPFTVQHVQSINLQPEFPPPDPTQPISATNPLPPLIVGNTEKFVVAGSLANGDLQDLSSQSTMSVQPSASTAAQFGGTSGVNNLLTALGPGGVFVSANYNGGGAGLGAPSLSVTARSVPLVGINICWTDQFTLVQSCPAAGSQQPPTVQAGSLTPVQFHAIGNYGGTITDAHGNQVPLTQDVTRQTAWSSSAPGVASIGSNDSNAGEVLGLSQGSVTIQALNTSASNVPQQFSQVIVEPIQQQQ